MKELAAAPDVCEPAPELRTLSPKEINAVAGGPTISNEPTAAPIPPTPVV